MKRHLLVALAAVLALGIYASAARAQEEPPGGNGQCRFEHPKSAKKLQSSLIAAFVSCGNPGGNSPTQNCQGGANDKKVCTGPLDCPGGSCVPTTAGGAVPACKPPETFCEQSGNCPGSGWEWDEQKTTGKVTFQVVNVVPPCPLTFPGCNPAPLSNHDLKVQLAMSKVMVSGSSDICAGGTNAGAVCQDDSECPGGVCAITLANGPCTLATVARATLNDRSNGDVTVIDFPAGFPCQAINGKIKLKTSADALLNGLNLADLPNCSAIEVVSVRLLDENGDQYAAMGTYLPDP